MNGNKRGRLKSKIEMASFFCNRLSNDESEKTINVFSHYITRIKVLTGV